MLMFNLWVELGGNGYLKIMWDLMDIFVVYYFIILLNVISSLLLNIGVMI